MDGEYWSRQMQLQMQMQPPAPAASAAMLKRPRSDYEVLAAQVSSGLETFNQLAPEDDRGGPRAVKDTQSLGSAYDNYLQSSQLSVSSGGGLSYAGSGQRVVGSGLPPMQLHDPVVIGPELVPNGRRMGFIGQLPGEGLGRPRETLALPPDASSTLYVEGLPPDCTKREVAHIFRPFVGYKEVRLVTKESKHRGGDALVLSFVDFVNPACAATALSALQGYVMDEMDSRSPRLRLQFSKFPGPRSGGSSRGKR